MRTAQAGQQSVNQRGIGTKGGPENLFQKPGRGPAMKLYFLYVLIAAIAVMAHVGARKSAATETDKVPV